MPLRSKSVLYRPRGAQLTGRTNNLSRRRWGVVLAANLNQSAPLRTGSTQSTFDTKQGLT
jgi:hypothetical protein